MVGRPISHYAILEKLGEGGMGMVWKAPDTRLNRIVAIKVLPPEKVADALAARTANGLIRVTLNRSCEQELGRQA